MTPAGWPARARPGALILAPRPARHAARARRPICRLGRGRPDRGGGGHAGAAGPRPAPGAGGEFGWVGWWAKGVGRSGWRGGGRVGACALGHQRGWRQPTHRPPLSPSTTHPSPPAAERAVRAVQGHGVPGVPAVLRPGLHAPARVYQHGRPCEPQAVRALCRLLQPRMQRVWWGGGWGRLGCGGEGEGGGGEAAAPARSARCRRPGRLLTHIFIQGSTVRTALSVLVSRRFSQLGGVGGLEAAAGWPVQAGSSLQPWSTARGRAPARRGRRDAGGQAPIRATRRHGPCARGECGGCGGCGVRGLGDGCVGARFPRPQLPIWPWDPAL